MLYAKLAILGAPYYIDKPYTYNVPSQLEDSIKVGSVVVVPFGGANTQKNGVVTELCDTSDCKTTKPILGVPGKYLYVSEEMLNLCRFMHDRLFCSFGDAVKCVLPAGLGVKSVKVFHATNEHAENRNGLNRTAELILKHIEEFDGSTQTEIRKQFGGSSVSCLTALENLGLCTSENGFECHINQKSEKYATLCADESKVREAAEGKISLTPRQNSVFEVLLGLESPCPVTELAESSGTGISVINELSKKGLVDISELVCDRNADLLKGYSDTEYGDFDLSDQQKNACDTLCSLYEKDEARAALLYGVTGSGKTNVILKLIDRVLEDGKSVIVLVPEIALTSQTVGRFAVRYGDKIALIHSGLSAGERMDAWKKITEDKAKIVIGTRSAVFAPVNNLGLVVLDEEQESSFKSDKTPKFHARDVARFRCAYNKALMVLCSATPGIDSFYKAQTGKYTLVSLTERYSGLKLPQVLFHDMRSEPYFTEPESNAEKDKSIAGGIPTTIGSTLHDEIQKNLDAKEQTILFINRRGYRAFAQCHSCGHTFECPNCSVALTHHHNKRYGKDTMVCHYCGYTQTLPDKCPTCGKSDSIVYMGAGTQLLESSLVKMFPDVRVLRMDADTTGGKMGHENILEAFRNGEADVLVGTQMVAKGHDFPNVSLVGVINADTSLYMNDFRANEKTFSLLTQVLGRAGRTGKQGRAVIQTYSPDNDILRLSGLQDYKAFYDREILFRKASLFPPFCDIITVSFSGMVENDVVNSVKEFGEGLDEAAKGDYKDVKFILFGPFRNDVYRIAGRYRMRYILKCSSSPRMREMLSGLLKKYMPGFKHVTISADVNPSNL